MTGKELRRIFEEVLPLDEILAFAQELGVVQRQRKLDVAALVLALVITARTPSGGWHADALVNDLDLEVAKVTRSSFYAWFDPAFEKLMARLEACYEHGVSFVIRLKEGWKAKVDDIARGTRIKELTAGSELDTVLSDTIALDGKAIDCNVRVGATAELEMRLVGIPTPKGYCFFDGDAARLPAVLHPDGPGPPPPSLQHSPQRQTASQCGAAPPDARRQGDRSRS